MDISIGLNQGSSISFRRGPNSADNTKPRATDLYVYIYIYIYNSYYYNYNIIVAFVKIVTRCVKINIPIFPPIVCFIQTIKNIFAFRYRRTLPVEY